jgi:hypothetical protein
VIPNDALINALRSLNFSFKRQADRVMIYKQNGSTRRVGVRRRDYHDESSAREVLKLAGMPADKINEFIASAKKNNRH